MWRDGEYSVMTGAGYVSAGNTLLTFTIEENTAPTFVWTLWLDFSCKN
jgi:hypothetical protein